MKSTKLITSVCIIFFFLINYSTAIYAQHEYAIRTEFVTLNYDEDARKAGFGSINSEASDEYSDAGAYSNLSLLSRTKKTIGGSYAYNRWTYPCSPDDDTIQQNNLKIQYSFNKNAK